MLQELQQGRRSDAAHPTEVDVLIGVIAQEGKGNHRTIAVGNAAPPHVHATIGTEHIGIVVDEVELVLHELFGILGIEVAIHLCPNGTIHLEGPHAVIVIGGVVIVPSLATVAFEKLLEAIFEAPVIDLVALLLKEADNEDVEKHPVARDGGAIAIAEHGGGKLIFLFLCKGIPQYFLSRRERDGQSAKLHKYLTGATVRSAVLDVAGALRVGEAEQLMAVVVGHLNTIEREVGALLEQGSCHEEGAAEALKFSRRHIAFATWIGLVVLLGEVHRVVHRADVGERSFEQPLGGINPPFTVEPSVGAYLVVGRWDGERLFDAVRGHSRLHLCDGRHRSQQKCGEQ